MAFGKYCSNTLGVVKLRTENFVLVCLGSDWRYASGLEVVRKFGNFVVRNFCILGKPLGEFSIRPPFSHSQKSHYCLVHSV